MFTSLSFQLLLAISLVVIPRITLSQEQYCNCTFDVHPDNETYPCSLFGQLGDGELIAWQRADPTCLDDLMIHNTTIDADRIFAMCPFPNSTNASLESIFAEIRTSLENDGGTNSTAIKAIQAQYPRFWKEDPTSPGSFVFADTIYDSRESPVQCTTSINLCWGVIKDYFTATPGALDMLCKEFHFWYVHEQVLEQSFARRFLCELNGTDAPSTCEVLSSQVLEIKEENPTIECDAYGNGPGDIPLPSNLTCKAPTTNNNTDSSGSFTTRTFWKFGLTIATAAAALLL